jgi:urease accessory protein
MSAAVLPSEALCRETPSIALGGIRVRGRIDAALAAAPCGTTRIARLSETGGYRLRFPRTHAAQSEAVVINTGGGVVGGDVVALDFQLSPAADAVITTQAAERIYRSTGAPSRIEIALAAAAGARLAWLPQETILFSGSRLQRRFEVDVAADASVLMVESLVFGRAASGEVMRAGSLKDVWRVRREGRLLLAESTRLDAISAAVLDRPAVLNGARAVATLLYVASDAEGRLLDMRAALADQGCEWGASAWSCMLAVRFLAPAAEQVRAALVRAAQTLRGAPMPRVWMT